MMDWYELSGRRQTTGEAVVLIIARQRSRRQREAENIGSLFLLARDWLSDIDIRRLE